MDSQLLALASKVVSILTRHNDECIEFIGRINRGYGEIVILGKTYQAHRVSYESAYGEIPKGLHVLHYCDNRSCVNPKHLGIGTQQDNMNDMLRKHRSRDSRGENNENAKLTWEKVREIRAECAKGFTQRSIAKLYGVDYTTVNHIVRNYTWKEAK
jgi:hypothetical protein